MAENAIRSIVLRIRKQLAMSQEEFARLLSTTKAAVQHWERGRNKPELARLVTLARISPSRQERNLLRALLRNTPQYAQTAARPPGPNARRPLVRPSIHSPRRLPADLIALRSEQKSIVRRVTRMERMLARMRKELRDIVNHLRRIERAGGRLLPPK